MKKERMKNGWSLRASAFSISSFTAKSRSVHRLLRERVAVEDGAEVVGVERLSTFWYRALALLRLIPVADRLRSRSLRLVSSKTSPRMSNTRPFSASLSTESFSSRRW
jgi:hypothetical protein